MQTTVSAATPHQTNARRCVTVWAMKSLMRMSSASVLQTQRLYNGWLVISLTPGFSPVQIAPKVSAVSTAFLAAHAQASR